MLTNLRKFDYFKTNRLKQVVIALVGIWVIVLIAAMAATIYREIDGPTVRSTITKNLNLTSINSTLDQDLNSARYTIDQLNLDIDQLNDDLEDFQSDHAGLKSKLESYVSSVPLNQVVP